MKNSTPKFFLIKMLIITLINMGAFAIAFVCTQIFKTLDNSFLAACIASGISNLAFLAYIFKTSGTMKNDDNLSIFYFTVRETFVYVLFLLIPLVVSFLGTDNWLFRFFMPNTFFVYLTKNVPLGLMLESVTYFAVVYISRKLMPSNKN